MSESIALVTGASGFVGRHLCELLRGRNITVRGVFRTASAGPWDESVLADLSEGLPDAAMDDVGCVFHLAGRAHAMSEPDAVVAHQRATVAATERLLDACRRHPPSSLVYLSSTKAVGEPGDVIANEHWEVPPADAYGEAKRMAEERVLGFGAEQRIPVTVLRPPMVLGAGAKGNAHRMLQRALQGKPIPIPEFGRRRSMVHVLDLVEAMALVSRADEPRQRRYFIAHPRGFTTREMIGLMRAAGGFPEREPSLPGWLWAGVAASAEGLARLFGPAFRERLPLDWDRFQRLREAAEFDASLLKKETGFVASRGLREAIADMAQTISTAGGR